MSFFGVPGYDDRVADLKPDNAKRFRDATAKAKAELQAKLATERDPNVRQDLEIMIQAADENIETSELNETPDAAVERRAADRCSAACRACCPTRPRPSAAPRALDRLKAYVGQAPGTTPITELATRTLRPSAPADKALLRPTKLEVEQALGNVDTYVDGIRKLFAKYKVAGADAALAAMETQLQGLRPVGAQRPCCRRRAPTRACRPSCTPTSSSSSASTSIRSC